MYSDAERAAFMVLLARARANEVITEEEIEAMLPFDLFTRVIRLTIEHENTIIDRYNEEVWEKWRVDPPEIKFYKDQLYLGKKNFAAAPARLQKLMPRQTEAIFGREIDVLRFSKLTAWKLFNDLSPTDKLWAKPDSMENGWPPELVDIAPMRVVLPDVELPTAYGIRRVLAEELGVDP